MTGVTVCHVFYGGCSNQTACHSERKARKNPYFFKREADCHSRLYGLAMTGVTVCRVFYGGCSNQTACHSERKARKNPYFLKRGTDCHSRLHGFAMTGVWKTYSARLSALAMTAI